jgi:hypothetical protein
MPGEGDRGIERSRDQGIEWRSNRSQMSDERSQNPETRMQDAAAAGRSSAAVGGHLYVVVGRGPTHNFPVGGTDRRPPWGLLSNKLLNEA